MRQNRLNKKLLFNDVLNEWIGLQKNQLKESTYATYSNHIEKHIKSYFEGIRLNKVNHNLVQGFINEKLKSGRLDNKGGLSIKTVKELVNVIKLTLKYSMDSNYLNAIHLEFKYPIQRKELRMISDAEYNKLTAFLKRDSSPFSIGILLILCTGIRIGELCALKNKDIDLIHCELYINKTLQRIQDFENHSTRVIISTTKTVNSTRIIPIPHSLIPYIKINNQQDYFLTQSYRYIEPRTFRYKFKKLLKKLHISEVTVHSLRHFFASRCIELGFDYNCLSEILGHSSPSTTMNLYVHSKDKFKQECMNKIII